MMPCQNERDRYVQVHMIVAISKSWHYPYFLSIISWLVNSCLNQCRMERMWYQPKQRMTDWCDGPIESSTTLHKDRKIHPSVKDLQSKTRLAESWKLHIFDTRVDFPVPNKVAVDYFSPIPLKSVRNPLFYFRNYYRTFSDHPNSMSRNCESYDITTWRHYITSVLSKSGKLETSFWILIKHMDIRVWGRRKSDPYVALCLAGVTKIRH